MHIRKQDSILFTKTHHLPEIISWHQLTLFMLSKLTWSQHASFSSLSLLFLLIEMSFFEVYWLNKDEMTFNVKKLVFLNHVQLWKVPLSTNFKMKVCTLLLTLALNFIDKGYFYSHTGPQKRKFITIFISSSLFNVKTF